MKRSMVLAAALVAVMALLSAPGFGQEKSEWHQVWCLPGLAVLGPTQGEKINAAVNDYNAADWAVEVEGSWDLIQWNRERYPDQKGDARRDTLISWQRLDLGSQLFEAKGYKISRLGIRENIAGFSFQFVPRQTNERTMTVVETTNAPVLVTAQPETVVVIHKDTVFYPILLSTGGGASHFFIGPSGFGTRNLWGYGVSARYEHGSGVILAGGYNYQSLPSGWYEEGFHLMVLKKTGKNFALGALFHSGVRKDAGNYGIFDLKGGGLIGEISTNKCGPFLFNIFGGLDLSYIRKYPRTGETNIYIGPKSTSATQHQLSGGTSWKFSPMLGMGLLFELF